MNYDRQPLFCTNVGWIWTTSVGGHAMPAHALDMACDQLMALTRRIPSVCFVTNTLLVRWDRLWQSLACVLCCFAGIAGAEVVRLGGPRNIIVDVEDVRGGFSITVEMRPVSCFDAATNARINRSKACLYGLTGLGKSLDIDPDRLAAGCDISGVDMDDASQNGDRYRVRFFVPESGIREPEQTTAADSDSSDADASASPPRNRSQLFTCVDDYATTIAALKAAYDDRLAEIETKVVADRADALVEEHVKAARQALATLHLEAKAAFTAAGREFAADLRVLSTEKESLEKVLDAARADFEASSAKASARVETAAQSAAEKPTPTSTAKEPVRSL